MIKRIFCLLTVIMVNCSMVFSQETLPDTIVYGSESNFPPYEFLDKKGQPTGFSIDLIQAIAKDMGFNLKIKFGVWSDIQNELEEKGTVHISDMFYTSERAEVFDFAMPHDVTYDEIYIRIGQEGIYSIKDLSGKKVAILRSSTIQEYLQLKYPDINLILLDSQPEALKFLSEGKCDAAIVSHVITDDVFKTLHISNLVSIGHPQLPREYCFVVKGGNASLLRTINSGLVHLKNNGKFDELHKKWLAPKTGFQYTKYILIFVLILIVTILFFFLWNRSLRYAVKFKTKELEFLNSRLRLISSVKAARIDKLSTAEQTVELLKQVKHTFEVDACIVRILVKNEMKLLGSIGIAPENLDENRPVFTGISKPTLDKKINKPNLHDSIDSKNEFENELAEYDYNSFAGAQMVTEGRVTGILLLFCKNINRQFTSTDLDHLQIVANQIGISIENTRLFDQNEKQKEILVKQIISNKKAKEEIQKLNSELEERVIQRTSQLEAANNELQSFVYSVSHDLRAPLRSIMGFSEIISRRHTASLNEEGQKYFGYVLEASKNMANLIEDLLLYSRLSKKSIEKENIELNDILDQVLQSLNQDILLSNAKIVIPENLPLVYADRSLLGQILSNLISNAIKYHRKGINPEIIISVDEDMEHNIIKVTDNGQGIPKMHHEKIFNIFQRLHSSDEYPGTGIGLSIVKKAVESLGGKIIVESEIEKGSTFIVVFQRNIN